jgi:hypothetical protein
MYRKQTYFGWRLDSSLPHEIFDLSKLVCGTYGIPGCYWSKFCGYFRNRSLLLELYEVNIKNFVHSEITSMKSSIYKPSKRTRFISEKMKTQKPRCLEDTVASTQANSTMYYSTAAFHEIETQLIASSCPYIYIYIYFIHGNVAMMGE